LSDRKASKDENLTHPGSGDSRSHGSRRWGNNFDRLFRGIQFDEFDGTVLYVYAVDEYRTAEIEDTFSLHISTIASGILKREIPIVMVLPQKLRQERDV
jgi:hypothetical protein